MPVGLCNLEVTKNLLMMFCFVFFVSGCSILALGIRLRHSFDKIEALALQNPGLLNFTYYFIVSGAVLIFLSLMGYLGSMFKKQWMLTMFYVLILVAIIVEMLSISYFFIKWPDIEDVLYQSMIYHSNIQVEAGNANEDVQRITIAWNVLQKENYCCGVNEPQEWLDITGKAIDNFCETTTTTPLVKLVWKKYEYDGCLISIKNTYGYPSVVVVLVVLALEVTSLTFACQVIRRLTRTQGDLEEVQFSHASKEEAPTHETNKTTINKNTTTTKSEETTTKNYTTNEEDT